MARPAALPLLAAAILAAVPAASAQSCGSFAEFSLLLGPMNEACCVGDSCAGGGPSSCPGDCASVLLPIQAACAGFFAGNLAFASIAAAIDSAAAQCLGGSSGGGSAAGGGGGRFTVVSGPCTLAEGGRCVGRPNGYLPNEACEVRVGTIGEPLSTCPVFDTGAGDILTLPDGSQHQGGADCTVANCILPACPAGSVLMGGEMLAWASDSRIQGDGFGGLPVSRDGIGGGWQICFEGASAGGQSAALDSSAYKFKPIAVAGGGGGGGGGFNYCTDPVCAALPTPPAERGSVVIEGCAAGGALGSLCRIGCLQGFEAAGEQEGSCSLGGGADGALAAYIGQSVTCNPERAPDGTMSAAYCELASTEAILDCCELLSSPSGGGGGGGGGLSSCSEANPPQTCPLGCAERWLPLFENCEIHLSEFAGLSAACEAVAGEFLSRAPSALTVSGLECHPDANGVYQLQQDTIGGKAHWQREVDGQTFHVYAINEPHNGWVVGDSLDSFFLIIESYEEPPPWGQHEWREVCHADGAEQERAVLLEPAFTAGECEEELRLLSPEMTEFCCAEGDPTFEELVDAGTSLTDCPYDCAHRWFLYSEECGEHLTSRHPGLAAFSAACTSTHAAMAVISPVDGHLAAGAEDEHFFSSQQGLMYEIEEVPGPGLQRSELAVEAPGTHHVLADRLDLTKQGAGPHTIEWYAAQSELGVDIAVAALEGEGDYHLEANIVGTAARLAPEAIVYSHNSSGVREVLLLTECRWFDDCTYRYHGVEMRGDGSSYELRFHPTAGMTYSFRVHLKDGSAATHIRLGIYPPDSIAANADCREAAAEMAAMFGGGGGCELPPLLQRVDGPNPNVVDMKMGSFTGPAGGRPSWGDLKCDQDGAESRCCEDPTRVGPPEQPCGGTYRHYPGETFAAEEEWEWTAPSTGEFLLKVTSNCDVPFYSDPTQPGCETTEDGISCSDTSVERCDSAVGMTIITVDRAVHVKHRFDVPLPPGASDERQILLASMFQTSQAPAMAFPTKIVPLDCNNPEQAGDRPLCAEFLARQQQAGGGGHRRELQELGCPHSTFLQREQTMLTACGLPSTAADVDTSQLPYDCPSVECAEELVELLDDCSDSIRNMPDAALYRALEQSSMLVDCEEMDQQAANFATVEVEFHAPSLAIANQMVTEHEERSAQLASMFNRPGCAAAGGEGRGRRLNQQLTATGNDGAGQPLSAESESESESQHMVAMLRRQLRERDRVIEKQAAALEVAATHAQELQRRVDKCKEDKCKEAETDRTGHGHADGSRHRQLQGSGDSCRYANDGECDEPRYCTTGTDSSDCAGPSPPPLPASSGGASGTATFQVRSGPCTLSQGGQCVGRDEYSDDESCEIAFTGDTTLEGCPVFDTEVNFDFVTIDGAQYGGTECPEGTAVTPSSSITWTSDESVMGSGWEICASPPPPIVSFNPGGISGSGSGATFQVRSGPCTLSQGGQCVGRGEYSDDESCDIAVTGDTRLVGCPVFDTERGFDIVMIDRRQFDGNECPEGTAVTSASTITWTSDGSQTASGWKICAPPPTGTGAGSAGPGGAPGAGAAITAQLALVTTSDGTVKACVSHPCEAGVCQNGGQCAAVGEAAFECTCASGWEGTVCGEATPASSKAFAGSDIITGVNEAEWSNQLLTWLGEEPGESEWALCYSSFLHPTTSAAEFHSRCDVHNETLVIGTNQAAGGQHTFGGYAMRPWLNPSMWDDSASGDWIFRLDPLGQFLPNEHAQGLYQYDDPNYWPAWGGGDLRFGSDGELGHEGSCCQGCYVGGSYSGSPGDTCGVNGVPWGATTMEVWYRSAATTAAYFVSGTTRTPSEFAAFTGTSERSCHRSTPADSSSMYRCGALYVRTETTFEGAPVYEGHWQGGSYMHAYESGGFLWRRSNVDASSDHQRLPAGHGAVWTIGSGTYGDRSVECCEEGYAYFDSGECETPDGCVGSWREVDTNVHPWTMEINPTIVVRAVAGNCCSLAGTCCDCGEGVCNCDCGDVCGQAGWCDANDPGWDSECDRAC
eukprot:SAG22_NODE_312_length_12614_cov_4.783540_9_plen_2027_part_00